MLNLQRSQIAMAVLLLALPTSGLPKDKEPKAYPENGTVIAIHVNSQSHTTPVYTDPQGQTRAAAPGFTACRCFVSKPRRSSMNWRAAGSPIWGSATLFNSESKSSRRMYSAATRRRNTASLELS